MCKARREEGKDGREGRKERKGRQGGARRKKEEATHYLMQFFFSRYFRLGLGSQASVLRSRSRYAVKFVQSPVVEVVSVLV
ncbi:hypothetical protein CGGC5_v005220 [Colletotrichum fructicola Nara gc5]|uniref:Uncharacterized protein n=1 Tax=Colletotrichum fructicola (strain Nara gc5) TaxID=1213859 RepID=A0A7J6JC20_COLFN|nr:hypothetical protein CFRS1_v011693 [Colletotrichum fructicola]KAF4486345.1 hypothetical protein CGGC5_v005220 [Colletotrichum fructicola Nara gc5]KAF5495735.1 hypothetical protein CGCF413_v008839 [Colletotrichum fructicola]